ncbi:hypothetical protein H2200_008783 [Cladophialophora chaetospira]|uniref:Uncharacterized protein n=1 Tax=Cladophialophora chaetospira TaxID=386627 RepID=A0AA39CFX0_9EURO|nr:hypothetical protein H2200_008783 [Cladophialophora chaetospira]
MASTSSSVPLTGLLATTAPANLGANQQRPTRTLADMPIEIMIYIASLLISSYASIRPHSDVSLPENNRRPKNPLQIIAIFFVSQQFNAAAKAAWFQNIQLRFSSRRALQNGRLLAAREEYREGRKRLKRLEVSGHIPITWNNLLKMFPNLRLLTIYPFEISVPYSPGAVGQGVPGQPQRNLLRRWCAVIDWLSARGSAKHIPKPEIVEIDDASYTTRTRLFIDDFAHILDLQGFLNGLGPRILYLGNENEDEHGTYDPSEYQRSRISGGQTIPVDTYPDILKTYRERDDAHEHKGMEFLRSCMATAQTDCRNLRVKMIVTLRRQNHVGEWLLLGSYEYDPLNEWIFNGPDPIPVTSEACPHLNDPEWREYYLECSENGMTIPSWFKQPKEDVENSSGSETSGVGDA